MSLAGREHAIWKLICDLQFMKSFLNFKMDFQRYIQKEFLINLLQLLQLLIFEAKPKTKG